MTGVLNHSVSRIIQQLIIDLGHGFAPGGQTFPVYYSNLPDQPPDAMCVVESEPRVNGRDMVVGNSVMQYGFQLQIRSNGHTTGDDKRRDIVVAFDQDVDNKTVTLGANSYTVHAVNRVTDIDLGKEDGTKRYFFTINATASIVL